MKLTHLDLVAFRSYRSLLIELGSHRVLFAGLNGVGKSTIRDSIAWTLLGHCSGTDARGAGAEVLIPTGEKSAEVRIGIAGVGVVSRTYTEKGGGAFSVDTFTGTSQIQQQALYTKLGTTPEFLDACLDTATFLDLTHIDAKALVLSLLNVRIPVGDRSLTLDELDVAYKQAFEDRKVAKKVLAAHVVPAPPTGQLPAVEAITAQLDKLRGELATLQQATGSVTGRRQALAEELARLDRILSIAVDEDKGAEIAALEAKIADLEAAVVPPAAEAPAPGDPQRLHFLQGVVARIDAHDPANGCVIDPEIPCKTLKGSFRARLSALNTEMKGLDPKASSVPEKAAASPLTVARQRLLALQTQHAARQSNLQQQEQANRRQEAIRQELDGLPQTADQEAQIDVLRSRIGKGEQLLSDSRGHAAVAQAHAQAVEKQRILKADVDRLETLVESLGPNGVRVQALATALSAFEAAVNPYVAPFGWTITFTVDPWEVIANGRPVTSYSKSEAYRIGIALQLGIASLSGLSFAVIDEMDMLDVANRALVTKMVLAAPLDQILILGTREAGQALPAVPGVAAYRLSKQNGQTVIAERSVA